MAEQHALQSSSGTNLADVLERVLDKGIVVAGDVKVFVGGIELLTVQIRLVVCSVDKAQEIGLDWWKNIPAFRPGAQRPALESPAPQLAKLEERLDSLEKLLTPAAPAKKPRGGTS
ncbi:MAG: gas vesicle protein [Deltaproteobacteria bacterium]|nr:gas vesicle protein [Deltaproteobacteria bacterium]